MSRCLSAVEIAELRKRCFQHLNSSITIANGGEIVEDLVFMGATRPDAGAPLESPSVILRMLHELSEPRIVMVSVSKASSEEIEKLVDSLKK
jgi:hypothetical protein